MQSRHSTTCQPPPRTYNFSSCLFPKIQKFIKKGNFAGGDLFSSFLWPQIRKGGSFYPGFVQNYQNTRTFGLFWGIFACSGLVLQNSAAYKCTCLLTTFDRSCPFFGILLQQNRDGGVSPTRAFSQTIKTPGIRPILEYFCLLCGGAAEQCCTAQNLKTSNVHRKNLLMHIASYFM